MSSGYGPVGRIEAMDRETTGVVSICVRECWTSSEDFVELVIDLPDGAVIDMSDGERVLLEKTRLVPIHSRVLYVRRSIP